MSKVYVCGFLFSPDRKKVCLIKKTDKHELKWMSEKYNGIGGKVEENEDAYDAMRREFLEEAGVDLWGWSQVCILEFKTALIYFYKMFSDSINDVSTVTDEEVCVFDVHDVLNDPNISDKLIQNLKWLIPLALDNDVSASTIIKSK